MNKEIVIKIDNVKKKYKLGTIGGGTLQGDIQSWIARKRGKEDPNLKIGESYSKSGTFWALKGIRMDIRKGDTIGIIGGNGAGKSTLLKLLSRVTGPTEGEIYIKGRISSMLEVGTGFHGELTGRENIYLNGAILGMSKKEVDEKIESIIDFSECRQFIDTPVKRYSSGMYVKLAFSVAAHLDSEILIMDEVLAVGDMKFQNKCLEKMISLAKNEDKTILYVSHNMNTIRRLCKKCIVMEKGKIVFEGNTEEAINIYLNNINNNKIGTYYDLSDREHSEGVLLNAKMNSVTLLNYENGYLEMGSKLKLKLNWNTFESLDDVRIKITISDKIDTRFATALSKPIRKTSDGEYNDVLTIDTSYLTEGSYFAYFTLYQCDDAQEEIVIDDIRRVFSFEVVSKKIVNSEENNIRWLQKYYGYMRLPDIEINK